MLESVFFWGSVASLWVSKEREGDHLRQRGQLLDFNCGHAHLLGTGQLMGPVLRGGNSLSKPGSDSRETGENSDGGSTKIGAQVLQDINRASINTTVNNNAI